MITLFIAIGVGIIIGFLPTLPFIGMHWSLGVVLSLVVAALVFIRLMSKLNAKITPIFETYMKFMQTQKWKLAEEALEPAMAYKNRVFLLAGQIEAKRGFVDYYQNKEKEALKHFEKATSQDWVAMMIYAYLLMKNKKEVEMNKVFELTLKLNGKQPIIWNAYAFCLMKLDKIEDAIKVLNRASKKLGKNPETDANLNSLRNNKSMNMKPFGELWYSLKIEPVPRQMMQRTSQHPGDRGYRPRRV